MPQDADADGPLRVALVVERYTSGGSGVEHVVRALARGLAERGDDVHVIAHTADVDQPGVRVHRAAVPTKAKTMRLLEFSRAARRVVEGGAFDAVHGFARVHAQDLFHAGVGCHAAYLAAVHGGPGRALRRALPRHAVQLQLEAQLARDPGVAIQCVSESVADDFRRHYDVPDERLVQLPNGVDTKRFQPGGDDAPRRTLRAELAPGANAVWLFLGSGFRRKGLDTALEALARSRLDRAMLWVVGHDRPARWQRRARRLGVAERVRFLGERRDVDRLLFACDGLLLPTRYDPAPLVVLEAAASGRPVVTSGACGHGPPFVDTSLVVEDADDVAGFAAAMDSLADGRRRSRLGRESALAAAARDWPGVVEAHRDVYRSIARRRRAGVSR